MLRKFPKSQEIAAVYAVGVVTLYTWSLWTSVRDFAANWILYFSPVENLISFAYVLAGNLLESLLLIGFLLAASLIVPQKILAGRFVTYGTLLTVAFLGWLMLQDYPIQGTRLLCVMLAFVVLGEVKPALRAWVEAFADRCVVFAYIYPPLSVLALIVVAIRNIG